MEKKTLSNLLDGKIFRIPDYQRGYAWEEKQWKDFVEDIDALIDDKILSHYTGTIVTYQSKDRPLDIYGTEKLGLVDIVDGQQRLTTCSLYLAVILNELENRGKEEYKEHISKYLYKGSKSKLRLNNDTADFYFDLVSKGTTNVKATSVHQQRLFNAYIYLRNHISEQIELRGLEGTDYLSDLFDAIIRKLSFSFYPIEVESEIGMTFELMNSRGKDLSSLELLKNYLMYWVYRNVSAMNEKEDLTNIINKAWKETYINIAKCSGSENQCLRIAWTLFESHSPKHWDGYRGFKSDTVIPLRDFKYKSREATQEFIEKFTKGLAEISFHYSEILSLSKDGAIQNEYKWLAKIKNAGNIANYLPLMIASRIKVLDNKIDQDSYIHLLKSIELYSYRVFLWSGKRSNAGLSKFYRWADDVFENRYDLDAITGWIMGTVNLYSNENSFRKELSEDVYDWYHQRRLLRYTLYEYELHLLEKEGKDSKPKLAWHEMTDATIEHILPQKPAENSSWFQKWSEVDMRRYRHDISNLVLTKDNSHYSNFDFERKKGAAGSGHSYSNSDIRQERKIAKYDDWTAENCRSRRKELEDWIIKRWGIDRNYEIPQEMIDLDEDN